MSDAAVFLPLVPLLGAGLGSGLGSSLDVLSDDVDWKDYIKSAHPIDPVDPEVLALADQENDKLTFFHVSGPAIKAVRFTEPLVSVFVLLFPVAAWAVSACPNPQQGDMYAYCPNWLWVMFVPVFLLMTRWEWKCFRIAVVPFVQWLAPFNILGYRVTLRAWLAFTFMMSSTAKLDIATNSLFAAKIFATFTCRGSLWSTAQAAWEETIKTSMAAHLPLVNQLIFICLLGWVIMLVQQAITFLMVHPCKGLRNTNFEWRGEPRGYCTPWTWLTSRKSHIWHADAVRILAPAIRNLTMMSQSCNWQMARINKHLEMRGTSLVEQSRCFDMLHKECHRMVLNLWFVIIFERAIVMETQTSMYALTIAVDKGCDRQIYLALLVSFVVLIKALYDAHCQVKTLLRTHEQVMKQVQELMEQRSDDEAENDFTTPTQRFWAWLMNLPGPGDLPIENDVLLEARRAKVLIILGMRCGTLVLLLILAHTFVKLVMAPNCKYGFWNMPTSWESLRNYGCVDLSNITKIMDARKIHA